MPELPEVETTRRGIAPHLIGHTITHCRVHDARLRWPVPPQLGKTLSGQKILGIERRAKYLLVQTQSGHVIIHLGMSGSLRLLPQDAARKKHDHLEICLDDGLALRLHDPRRFGAVLWTEDDPLQHALLAHLGPEPLSSDFTPEYLLHKARGRKRALRDFLLDSRIVAGVGNIYANEALFLAGLRPGRAAGRLSAAQAEALVSATQRVLRQAIEAGGTTLRDFLRADGKPGYFQLTLNVYGRPKQPCLICGTHIKLKRLGQRSAFYCPQCQR